MGTQGVYTKYTQMSTIGFTPLSPLGIIHGVNPFQLQEIGPTCYVGQGFGKNYNPSYHDGGLLGHTGVDVNCGWGTPIKSLTDGLVYSTYPVEYPASDGYTAVFVITETALETFEMSYGHVSEIDCVIGQKVQKGDAIAKEGNKGTVYSGNTLITLAQQAAGVRDGHHRHYQKRPVVKIKQMSGRMLYTAQGVYRDEQGNYYQVFDYNNGFNGCTDWSVPLFNRNLAFGMSGYDVYLLQKACVKEGCATFNPTGFFGVLTVAAVVRLQQKNNISPTLGYCGPITREYLNNTYLPL